MEGHVQPERSPFAHAGRNCTYPIGHDQGRTGEPTGRRAHQGGRRKAEGLLPVLADAVHAVRARNPVQAVPADGLQQVQPEGKFHNQQYQFHLLTVVSIPDANTYRTFQKCSGGAAVALVDEQSLHFEHAIAQSPRAWRMRWIWPAKLVGRNVQANADGAANARVRMEGKCYDFRDTISKTGASKKVFLL